MCRKKAVGEAEAGQMFEAGWGLVMFADFGGGVMGRAEYYGKKNWTFPWP